MTIGRILLLAQLQWQQTPPCNVQNQVPSFGVKKGLAIEIGSFSHILLWVGKIETAPGAPACGNLPHRCTCWVLESWSAIWQVAGSLLAKVVLCAGRHLTLYWVDVNVDMLVAQQLRIVRKERNQASPDRTTAAGIGPVCHALNVARSKSCLFKRQPKSLNRPQATRGERRSLSFHRGLVADDHCKAPKWTTVAVFHLTRDRKWLWRHCCHWTNSIDW